MLRAHLVSGSVVAVLVSVAACSGSSPTGADAGDGRSGSSPTLPGVGGGGATGGSTSPGQTPLKLAVQARRIGSGADFSCAVLESGAVKCWGRNDFGQLGVGDTSNRGDAANELGDKLPAVDLGAKASAVAVGWYHACALLEGGTVKCWGKNDVGQLGLGDTTNRGTKAGQLGAALPAIDLGYGKPVVALAAGGYHTCALFEDGAVKCWGASELGQVGLGDTNHRGDAAGEMGAALGAVDLGAGQRAVGLAAGNYHSCAVLEDGGLKCWGNGVDGQLGLGFADQRGDGPDEMGDKLPRVELGAGVKVVQVAAGGFHTCALLDGGAIKCWGHNDVGQQGLGDKTKRGDDLGEMGDALPVVSLGAGRKAVGVSTLYDHTCAWFEDGSLKCWGWNHAGQLGLGDKKTRGDDPGEMADALPVVNLGAGQRARELGVGWDHACARLESGALKCWGVNWAGQLGIGDNKDRGAAASQMGDQLPTVKL